MIAGLAVGCGTSSSPHVEVVISGESANVNVWSNRDDSSWQAADLAEDAGTVRTRLEFDDFLSFVVKCSNQSQSWIYQYYIAAGDADVVTSDCGGSTEGDGERSIVVDGQMRQPGTVAIGKMQMSSEIGDWHWSVLAPVAVFDLVAYNDERLVIVDESSEMDVSLPLIDLDADGEKWNELPFYADADLTNYSVRTFTRLRTLHGSTAALERDGLAAVGPQQDQQALVTSIEVDVRIAGTMNNQSRGDYFNYGRVAHVLPEIPADVIPGTAQSSVFLDSLPVADSYTFSIYGARDKAELNVTRGWMDKTQRGQVAFELPAELDLSAVSNANDAAVQINEGGAWSRVQRQ